MPNIKDFVDALTALTAPVAGDLVYVRNAAGNRKMTVQNLLNGVNTLPIDRRDGGDIGGYLMDGEDDYFTVSDNANLDMGLNDFSIELFVRLADYTPSAERLLIEKHASNLGYKLLLTTAGKLKLQFGNGTDFTTFSYESDATAVTDDSWAHFLVTADRDGNALYYVNGILNKTVDISGSVAQTLDNAGALNVFGNGTSYTLGRVAIVRAYNRILTATETANTYNNGRPDLYEFEYKYRSAKPIDLASGWDFTSGWTSSSLTINDSNTVTATGANSQLFKTGYLTAGKAYKLVLAGSIDTGNVTFRGANGEVSSVFGTFSGSFSGTYYARMETSNVFNILIATSGAVLDLTTFGLYPIGCNAEYSFKNAGSLGWIESSGNQLSGSTSGSPICLTKEVIRPPHYRDIRKSIAANTNTTLTNIVPRGYKIVSIRAKGSDSLADIKIGSSSGGEQIVATTTTSSTTPKLLTLASTANDAYSESANVTLYARHDTSASGKTMDLIFHFEKVGN